jgi:glycosyltransferase involved in cell wall biosynthesis
MSTSNVLDVVVPCYNPVKGWAKNTVNSFVKFQQEFSQSCRLILVNDGSTQGVSPEDIAFIQQALPDSLYVAYAQNQGKGFALREGMKRVKAPYVLTTDIDFPYTHNSMLALAEKLIKGKGLYLGHRKKNYYQKVPLFRKALSVSFRVALKAFLKLDVSDTQCGLKGFDNNTRNLFLQTQVNGYLYDLEFVSLCKKKGVSMHRVAVELKDGIVFTNMKMSILLKELRNFLKILRQA